MAIKSIFVSCAILLVVGLRALAFQAPRDLQSKLAETVHAYSVDEWGLATVNGAGLVTGVSAGDPTISASYSDYAWNWSAVEGACVDNPRTYSGSASCPVQAPTFNIAYSAYIPVDHVTGPSACSFGSNSPYLIYMGDAYRGTARASQFVNVVPDTQTSSAFSQSTGQTRNYGYASPANGSTLSAADEDGVANDCYVWNNAATASTSGMSWSASWPAAHKGDVNYNGSASNPLESQWAAIYWNIDTYVDATNQQSPTAHAIYTHTCYPSHQISVNGQVIYLYTPSYNNTVYIGYCLSGLGNITGGTDTVLVPNH